MLVMEKSTEITWPGSPTEPEIRSERRDGDIVSLEIFVDENLFQFQGHFPGEPVLPGVAQIDWAAKCAVRYFAVPARFPRIGQLKFSKLIVANSVLSLRLEYKRDKGRIVFSFSEGGEVCSSGFFELAAQ